MVDITGHVHFFFFNDTATTEIYTLSLHDALPISEADRPSDDRERGDRPARRDLHRPGRRTPRWHRLDQRGVRRHRRPDRKSTRLNSSHANISYAVFCLKKKNLMIPFAHIPSSSFI